MCVCSGGVWFVVVVVVGYLLMGMIKGHYSQPLHWTKDSVSLTSKTPGDPWAASGRGVPLRTSEPFPLNPRVGRLRAFVSGHGWLRACCGGVPWGPPMMAQRGGNGSYSHWSARRARGGGQGSCLRRAPREASYRRAAGRRTRCGATPGRQPRHPITSSQNPVQRRHLCGRAAGERTAPCKLGSDAQDPGAACRAASPPLPSPCSQLLSSLPAPLQARASLSTRPCPWCPTESSFIPVLPPQVQP